MKLITCPAEHIIRDKYEDDLYPHQRDKWIKVIDRVRWDIPKSTSQLRFFINDVWISFNQETNGNTGLIVVNFKTEYLPFRSVHLSDGPVPLDDLQFRYRYAGIAYIC